jgi:hypothetical protein
MAKYCSRQRHRANYSVDQPPTSLGTFVPTSSHVSIVTLDAYDSSMVVLSQGIKRRGLLVSDFEGKLAELLESLNSENAPEIQVELTAIFRESEADDDLRVDLAKRALSFNRALGEGEKSLQVLMAANRSTPDPVLAIAATSVDGS